MRRVKLFFKFIIAVAIVCFYVFRYRTNTLPLGIPSSLEVTSVEIEKSYSDSSVSRYPVVFEYKDKWEVDRKAKAANLFLSNDYEKSSKVIIELKVKDFKTGETSIWIYGIF